jgi:hypothetical protein
LPYLPSADFTKAAALQSFHPRKLVRRLRWCDSHAARCQQVTNHGKPERAVPIAESGLLSNRELDPDTATRDDGIQHGAKRGLRPYGRLG